MESPRDERLATAMLLTRAAVFGSIVLDAQTTVVFQMDRRHRSPRVLTLVSLLHSTSPTVTVISRLRSCQEGGAPIAEISRSRAARSLRIFEIQSSNKLHVYRPRLDVSSLIFFS